MPMSEDTNLQKNRWKRRLYATAGEDRHQAPDHMLHAATHSSDTAHQAPRALKEPEGISNTSLLTEYHMDDISSGTG